MIIWSGLGILVFVSLILGFVLSLLLTPIAESIFGPSASNYGFALAILAASVINWAFNFLLKKKGNQALIDPKTGASYQLQRSDSFFFIPISAFTYIFLVFGSFLMIPAFLSGPVPEFSDEDLERRSAILIKDNEKLIVVLRKGKTDKMILSGPLSYQPSRNTVFVESNRLVYLFDKNAKNETNYF